MDLQKSNFSLIYGNLSDGDKIVSNGWSGINFPVSRYDVSISSNAKTKGRAKYCWINQQKLLHFAFFIAYLILSFDQFDNVRRIMGESTDWAAFYILLQQIINIKLFFGYGKNDIDWIFFDFLINLWNRRIVQIVRVSVNTFGIQMTWTIIRFNNTTEFT